MEVLYHYAKFGGNRTMHVGVRGQRLMLFTFLFVCHSVTRRPFQYVADFLQQHIGSAFVGWFRWWLHLFSPKKSPFQWIGQIWKLPLVGATMGVQIQIRTISKFEKMGAKFVCTTLAIYKRDERNILPQPFIPCIVNVHPYKNILLPCYRMPQKTVKLTS